MEVSVRPAVSIVVPAFNEAKRLDQSLPVMLSTIDPQESEVILVDDGSSDNTVQVASSLLAELPNAHIVRLDRNRGKGAAVRAGVSVARGSTIAYMDADMAGNPADLQQLRSSLERAEVAIGSRSLPQSSVHSRDPRRMLMSAAFNKLVRYLTSLDVSDTQCGFKAFRASAGKLLFHASKVERFGFDVEILLLAQKLGFLIDEVPIEWTDVPGSHVRPFVDSVQMVGDVVRTEIHWYRIPPVEAIAAVYGQDFESAQNELLSVVRDTLRGCDPVVPWSRGAIALFPGLSPKVVDAIRKRVQTKLQDCAVVQSRVKLDTLQHPSAEPLMSAIRGFEGGTAGRYMNEKYATDFLLAATGVA